MKRASRRRWRVVCWLVWVATGLNAQLDTIHWIPPMYPGPALGEQYIYLTTPETTPFQVTIRKGSGAVVTTAQLSRDQPVRFLLSSTYGTLLIDEQQLQQVLSNAGLVIHGSRPFHAGLRVWGLNQGDACYLTCKGRSALGTTFRVGHLKQATDKFGGRFNEVCVMATEDNTTVTLSGYDPNLAELPPGPVSVVLQRGQSIVYVHYVGGIDDDQPRNGFLGALLTATKPVALTSGSWWGGAVVYDANDIAVDQQIPLEEVGKSYIFCAGTGPTSLEHPIVVAHYNNTKVWLNDDPDPVKVLQAGEYYTVPYVNYLPVGNIYVHTSEPVFAFQMIGAIKNGVHSLKAGGFMVVPPLHCGLTRSFNYVYLPAKLATQRFDGGLMIVAQRDSAVMVRVNGVPTSVGPPIDVRGTDEFVTYQAIDFFERNGPIVNDLEVESSGAILVTLLASRYDAAYSAVFAGPVIRRPEVHLSVIGDGICPDTLTATGVFDGLQWVYEDSLFQDSPVPAFLVRAPGRYKAIAYLSGCRNTATVADSLDVPLAAPSFAYRLQEPSCFGFSDGEIALGVPNGGNPPYQYSIDFGQHLSPDTLFTGVKAGLHKLVVLDATGCYNQPVNVHLGQPDDLPVQLIPTIWPRPLYPGSLVELTGTTTFNVTATSWTPPDTSGCGNCLTRQLNPTLSTWVVLTAYDDNGCPGTDSLWVEVEPPVFAPNSFAPESGGDNARFFLSSWKVLPVQRLAVFDRWGALVFEKNNFFTNTPDDGWDGRLANGQLAPLAVYTFFALVEVEPGRVVQVRGDVLSVR